MECVPVLLLILISLAVSTSGWQREWAPRSVLKLPDDKSVQVFEGKSDEHDDFRLLLAEEDSMLVGARNTVYNISMVTLQPNSLIEWSPEQTHVDVCQKRQKSFSECQNYIRVLVKKSPNQLYMCGTNAFKPVCRTYVQEPDGHYKKAHKDRSGVAICPYDPSHNTTAIYADGKLYSATVADFNAQDSLILESTHMVRTVQFDSKWLNEPDFVSSMEKNDLVYFFFRETAVENINCGKAVFSRVARVCKQDLGGNILLYERFTSFFKARLNCSIPGDFPFYFDEIQSTTEMGRGNYRATYDSGDRSDMVYAVFNTPENSIHGSAVCAFKYSDITRTFEGRFKGQRSFLHNWLTVPWDDTPQPHPHQCHNRSRELPDTTLNFIKTHPLMNNAVPASGGAPLLLHTSFQICLARAARMGRGKRHPGPQGCGCSSRWLEASESCSYSPGDQDGAQFTKIAVDWQVHAADDRYYDVMFVGTDDGRVIKAVNKGTTSKIETVVIEDIRVFDAHDPVTDIKVFRDKSKGLEKLIVVSREKVVSIPLHRCHTRKTCRTCVELQDPYCAWDSGACVNAERGIQNIIEGWRSGWNSECEEVTIYDEKEKYETTTRKPEPTEKCDCESADRGRDETVVVENKEVDVVLVSQQGNTVKKGLENESGGPRVGQSSEETPEAPVSSASVETLAIAIVVSIVLSMLVGFFIGYKVAGCRGAQNADASYMERTCSLQRGRNRLSSGEHPAYYNPDHAIMPKQMNYVVNVKGKLNTGSVETKPVTKSNKVYL